MNASNRIAAKAPLALLLAGSIFGLVNCSSGPDDPNAWYNYTMVENLTGSSKSSSLAATTAPSSTNASALMPPSPAAAQIAMVAPITAPEAELYRSEMSCGVVSRGAAGSASAAANSVALEMTECDVARRVGPPDKIELGSNQRGERILTLTYTRGDKPRIYRFASGRLVGIEVLPPVYHSSSKKR